MIPRLQDHFFRFLMISLSAHFALSILFFIGTKSIPSKLRFIPPKSRVIQVQTIDSKQLDSKKYRTVGERDGKRDHFSSPIQKIQGQPLDLSSFSLSKVTPHLNKQKSEKSIQKSASKVKLKSSEALYRLSPQERTKIIKESTIGHSSTTAPLLKKLNFNVEFTPPAGVAYNELNQQEKQFYSFQKRTFQQYFSTLLKTYEIMITEKPYLDGMLDQAKDILTARVTFDKFGNIQAIKMIKVSENDNIQNLFEKTIRNLIKVPNIPISLLTDEELFTTYYLLRIN